MVDLGSNNVFTQLGHSLKFAVIFAASNSSVSELVLIETHAFQVNRANRI